jgi:hypothetical protein
VSGSAVVFCSWPLLIRGHQRARCQAEIPLTAPSEIVEPPLTSENRKRYDRSQLRYPSDLTDEEWALVKPVISPAKRGGRKREADERDVLNAILYVLSTDCQWRALPKDFLPKSTVWSHLDLWRATTARRSAPLQAFM